MRILLTCDTSTNPNLGCQANTAALYENILKYQPETDIDCITLRSLLNGRRITMRERVYRGGKSITRTTGGLSIQNYDFMIINGEGGMGEYSKDRLSNVSKGIFSLIHKAKNAGVKTYMVNYTHNIHSKGNNRQAQHAYADCVGVSVREPMSFDRVKPLFPKVKLFPDLTCTHKKADTWRDNIIMVGGGTCLKTVSTDVAMKGYKRIVDQLLQYKHQYEIVLVGWPSMIKGDDVFFNEFMKRYKLPVERVNVVYFKDYIRLCSQASLNITGRHHGTVMSFLSGCPFLPIASKSCKVDGDNLLYRGGGRVLKLTDRDIEDQVEDHVARIGELGEQIQHRYTELKPYFDGHIRQIWHETVGL